jgi:hypothetical protein
MALTKEVIVDKIEVMEMGQLQVRTATKVMEDGELLSTSYHREVLSPGSDLAGQSQRVIDVANATWTADVVSEYNAYIEGLNTIPE